MTAIDQNRPTRRRLGAAGRSLTVTIAGGWIVLMVLAGAFAGLVSPYDPVAIDLRDRLVPPIGFGGTWDHLLGTDHLGRDLLSRLFHAARTSLLIAFIGTITGAVLGTTLGFLAAHFRGWVDDLVMVLVDFQAAMPFLIIAISVLAVFGNNFVVFLALVCIYGWERYARLARGLALATINQGYAVAAGAYGASVPWLYWRHILPNTVSVLVVNVTLNFPETVLLESSLSFLGLGVQPPDASLGSIISYGRDYLVDAWWIAVSPGVMIFLTTFSMSLLGDWLRDHLDPTLR